MLYEGQAEHAIIVVHRQEISLTSTSDIAQCPPKKKNVIHFERLATLQHATGGLILPMPMPSIRTALKLGLPLSSLKPSSTASISARAVGVLAVV